MLNHTTPLKSDNQSRNVYSLCMKRQSTDTDWQKYLCSSKFFFVNHSYKISDINAKTVNPLNHYGLMTPYGEYPT